MKQTTENIASIREFIATASKELDLDKDDRRALFDAIFSKLDSDFICECEMNKDFTVDTSQGEYRFIVDAFAGSRDRAHTVIDSIMIEEMESDPYILGCFNASFLTFGGIPIEMIEALQESDKYDVIGQWIIDQQHTACLQDDYVRCDGYGHHFAHYDHNEIELSLFERDWHVFRTS